MVLQSGVIPYEYATSLPLRAAGPGGVRIGLSGSFYEQAAFVHLAERRRYDGVFGNSFEMNPRFARYTEGNHDGAKIAEGPQGPLSFPGFGGQFVGSGYVYEPSNRDLKFAGDPPRDGAWIIDWIRDLRFHLDIRLGDISNETGEDVSVVRKDWFNQLYPGSLSGTGQYTLPTYLHRFPFQQNPDDLVPYSITASGVIRDMSLDQFGHSALGMSGALYDIDVGEVMFQPFPYLLDESSSSRMFREITIDGSESAPFGRLFPFFPAFQKTDGSMLTPTSRDVLFRPSNAITQLDWLHVGSGYIRADGDVLQDGTEYFTHPYDDPGDVSATSQFTHQVDGARRMNDGTSLPPADGFLRSYITPTAQADGRYQVIPKNPRSTFPNGAVESGVCGKADWEAFDDCLAIYHPSGLIVVSPHTGQSMYCFAVEQTEHSESSAYLETGGEAEKSWRNSKRTPPSFATSQSAFLEKIGSTIYKWLGVSTVSTATVMLDPLMHSYSASTFDHGSEVTGTTFDYAASSDDPTSFGWWTDGSDFFVSFTQFNSSPKVFKFTGTSLGLFEPGTGTFGTGWHTDVENGGSSNSDSFRGRIIGGTTYGFDVSDNTNGGVNAPTPSGTNEITYDDAHMRNFPPLMSYPIWTTSDPRELRIAPSQVGLSETSRFDRLQVVILDMREVSGGSSVTDGVWFLVNVRDNWLLTGPETTSFRYYFVRATATSTTWEAQEVLHIQGFPTTSAGEPQPHTFLHLDIP